MVNKLIQLIMIFSFASLLSCRSGKTEDVGVYSPTLTEQEIANKRLTSEVMLKMKRLSEALISKDGKSVIYGVTVYEVEENRGYTNIFLTNTETGITTPLTKGKFKDYNHRWSADGKNIYFLSNRSGSAQLWSMGIDGSKLKQVTHENTDINAFDITKNDRLWFTQQIKVSETAKDLYPMYPKAQAMIYDDLMARHWNYWLDGTFSHILTARIDEKGVLVEKKDIMQDEPWDAPLAPYFNVSEISWNNDGTLIAYTSKKMEGKEYALSTNSDIYLYNIGSGETKNITEGMMGYDRNPVFSPNDTYLAWNSMEREGNESDKERLFVVNLVTGEKSYITENFDYNAASIRWSDNDNIYFCSPINATYQICRASIHNPTVTILTDGLQDYNNIQIAGDKMIAEQTTISSATELYTIDINNGHGKELTMLNKHIYDKIAMGRVEKRMVTTTDDKQMLVWVVLPPDFDPAKRYPTLLYCQGGPQSVVSQSWSYRWNLQLMAAAGYIVVAPNRRGLPSFGQEWLDQISGDYSGQNIADYLSAIDDICKEPWVDTSRLGCVGASYGGYSVYYLAGHHGGRFKTFISHCGMFNFDSFYASTEELWFPNNDLGGSPWDDNETAVRSYANSPHKFVNNWDTPMMIMVGLLDYRIPYTESLQAFTAARLKGLEARIVAFEDEGHQVFKPQNALVWHSEFFSWLDKYLKPQE